MPRPSNGYTKLLLNVQPRMARALDVIASKRNTNRSALIRKVLEDYAVAELQRIKEQE